MLTCIIHKPATAGDTGGPETAEYLMSYFYASYYDIGVPYKLLPPCQGDRASLLAVFFGSYNGVPHSKNYKSLFKPCFCMVTDIIVDVRMGC